MNGKTIRQSLKTDVFTTAKLRLPDFLKKEMTRKPVEGTFKEARLAYVDALANDHSLSDETRRYYGYCLKALCAAWPELDNMQLTKIKAEDCQAWAARFAAEKDEQYFNNTLGTLRAILERAGLIGADNPAAKVKRIGVKPKQMQLPEAAQFDAIVRRIETAGARQSKDCANLVRFLAYSGCRISEAQGVTWADVDLEKGEMRVKNAKRSKASNAAEFRFVPIIPPMRNLLEKLAATNPLPTDRVCKIDDCEKSLTNACKKVGAPRITHHDLRHLFATRCIESGVDIPTVSRWLGHQDGGALAMKVYGHLRREHSVAMAQKVTFGGGQ
ncbi:MAG: tyrosine-type recombinase/integrase [Limisphaerales bacterium]